MIMWCYVTSMMAERPGSHMRDRVQIMCDVWPRPWHLITDHSTDCDWPLVIVRLLLTLFSWSGPVQVSSVISPPCHHWVTPMSGTRLRLMVRAGQQDPRKVGSGEGGGGLSLSNHPWRSPTYSALSCEVWDIPCVTQCHPRASHPPIETGAKLWIRMVSLAMMEYWLSVCPLPSPMIRPISPPGPQDAGPSPRVCQFSPQCYESCHPPDILHTLTSL